MVRHVDVGVATLDSGVIAEGVWEYVSKLVKSYKNKEMIKEDNYGYQVRLKKYFIFV